LVGSAGIACDLCTLYICRGPSRTNQMRGAIFTTAALLCLLAVASWRAPKRAVELEGAAAGAGKVHRCGAKCEKAWQEHLAQVQKKLAAEHKKPTETPTVPLASVLAKAGGKTHELAVQPFHRKGEKNGKWSARVEINRARRAARTPSFVKAELLDIASGKRPRVTEQIRNQALVKSPPRHAAAPRAHVSGPQAKSRPLQRSRAARAVQAHRPASQAASRLKLAEAILAQGGKTTRVNLRGAAVKWGVSHPVGAQNKLYHAHLHHRLLRDKNFWRRIGYGNKHYHIPWKAARQLQRKDQETISRRSAPADSTLAYLHLPADRGNPVDRELTKLGVEPNHSFKSLRRPVDHTLDYLHLPASHGHPAPKAATGVSSSGARGSDRSAADELAFERAPESHKKVDITALDTIESYERFEPKGA